MTSGRTSSAAATTGPYVARAQPGGTFATPQFVLKAFGYNAGGWRVEKHPRFAADTTGDGRADLVGFGESGVWIARGRADGTFDPPTLAVQGFGYSGGWRVEKHPRLLVDTTGDGLADIVGFGESGVWISRAKPDGTFTAPQMVLGAFNYGGGWRVDRTSTVSGGYHWQRARRHRWLRSHRRVGGAGPAGRQVRRCAIRTPQLLLQLHRPLEDRPAPTVPRGHDR